MADLPITSDEGATPVVITGAVSPYSTAIVNTDGSTNGRTFDGSGNSIGSTSGKLNVYDATVDTDLSTINASITNGNQIVQIVDTKKLSYSAAGVGIALAATPTDVITLNGSGTKTIRITRIAVTLSTTAGSGIGDNIQLIKRSSANTGGTSATLTAVPHDSSDVAATASAKSYTANATALGTTVGVVRSVRYAATTAGTANQEIVWDFGTRPSKELVLHGTAEGISINLGSTTITGGVLDASIEWTEE